MRYTTSMDQEMKRRVTACAAGFSLPRYRELPAVGLYLDQTVQLVNSCFGASRGGAYPLDGEQLCQERSHLPPRQKEVFPRAAGRSPLHRAVQERPLAGKHRDAVPDAARPLHRRRGLRLLLRRGGELPALHLRGQLLHPRPRPRRQRRKAAAAGHHRRGGE